MFFHIQHARVFSFLRVKVRSFQQAEAPHAELIPIGTPLWPDCRMNGFLALSMLPGALGRR
jgi:hypothetical protein